TTPPSAPADGTAWLVGTGASGDWAGEDGKLACHQAGAWIFVAPCNGMNLLNKANGQFTHYLNGWQSPALVAAPSGGTVIDSQARTAIAALISALQAAAILPSG
ncbi:MAG TPA: DUF2793 domain-containing protein, partial [Novosphingobium sp.]|nr:DUF2793 domain-containing protein [Novosphingobium sp.]